MEENEVLPERIEEEEDEVLEEAVFEREIESDDKLTVRDTVQAAGEIYGEYKKAYNSATKTDKAKILLILLPLAITFVLGFVGIFIANLGQSLGLGNIEIIGFVLMGIGLGGFFLTIVLLVVISKIKQNKK